MLCLVTVESSRTYKQLNRFYGMWLMALCLISLNLTSFIYTSDEDFQRVGFFADFSALPFLLT